MAIWVVPVGYGAPDQNPVVCAGVTDAWALPGQTADTVAMTLASLHPRYVSGLIRLGPGVAANLSSSTWDSYGSSFERVRSAVRAQHPDALFDVVLNARDYNDTAASSAADSSRSLHVPRILSDLPGRRVVRRDP